MRAMQAQVVAGDTLKPAPLALASFPAGTWTLNYRFTPRFAGAAPVTFAASAAGTSHQVNVPAATTADWAPGTYTCNAWVSNVAGERYAVASETCQVTVQPNPATLPAGTDTRSQAELALAAVTAMITGKATTAVQRYKINGRELESYPLPDLLKLERKLKADVDAERVAAGLQPAGGAKRILVRMP